MRLIAFAATSVMFADKPDIQAGLGLLVLFVCILAQKGGVVSLERSESIDHMIARKLETKQKGPSLSSYHIPSVLILSRPNPSHPMLLPVRVRQPYVDDTLNKVEEFGLIASWITLYGGTLLYSSSLSASVKAVVTVTIILINILFASLLVYLLVTSRETSQGVSHLAARLNSFLPSSRRRSEDSGYDDLGGIELRDREAKSEAEDEEEDREREDKVILHTNVMARGKGRSVRAPLRSQRRSNRPFSAAIARAKTQRGRGRGAEEVEVERGFKAKAKVKRPKEESEQDQHADAEKEGEVKSEESGEEDEEESDWQEILDPKTGQLYFYNQKTGQSQWERP